MFAGNITAMIDKIGLRKTKLFAFSVLLAVVTYGFPLSNFSVSIDTELPVFANSSLDLGRWGTNLVRYHIFEGHLPYFTLLLGLFFLALTAVELSKVFHFNRLLGYIFCGLFVTFPQMAYQLVFTMQADVVPLGFFISVLSVTWFLKSAAEKFSWKSASLFVLSALGIMFVISIYQALVFIPIIVFLIVFFQNTYRENFVVKKALRDGMLFCGLMLLSAVFYYISVKLLCPPVEGGYLSSYTSGASNHLFSKFYSVWKGNLQGNAFYGETLFCLALILAIVVAVKAAIERRYFGWRFVSLFLMLLLPFIMAFFITNEYYPPRIYVASGIVFAFLIIHTFRNLRATQFLLAVCSLICIAHVYMVTKLFYSNYRIYQHDMEIAKRIDFTIRSTYPNFDPSAEYVYFYGFLPFEHHQRFRLPDSEAFGGSLFNWGDGNNYRIINFFSYNDIAYYRMIDDKQVFLGIKDSMETLPVWPKPGSIKEINKVMVVKLGYDKGAPLFVE